MSYLRKYKNADKPDPLLRKHEP
ncbi:hypothetical protein KIPB_015648, partial [Kipferlia bialata]|eukprot:g15648.t1